MNVDVKNLRFAAVQLQRTGHTELDVAWMLLACASEIEILRAEFWKACLGAQEMRVDPREVAHATLEG